MLLVVASASMYFVENEAQPGVFASIPDAMWWGALGRLLGAVIALIGIGFFALPAGVLSAAFAEQLEGRRRDRVRACPHCGKEIG